MAISPQLRTAKAAAERDLMKIEGVTGVGIGEKIKDGKRTGEMSVRVYVRKKLPKSKVPQNEMIPATIDGMPTDVIERHFVLHAMRVSLKDLRAMADAGTYDPLTGGVSVGPCRVINGSVFVGTLGLVVEDNSTGDPMMLSNFHVMCVNNGWSAGDTMAQPGRVDGGSCPADVVGTLARATLGGQVDGAVSRITARNHDCRITEIGNVAGTAVAVEGEAVRKRGRTTGLTHGFVDDISLTVTVDYEQDIGPVTLSNQIGIDVDSTQGPQFGTNGDSGSVVVNANNEVIGLYYAGSEDGAYGVANPIASVLGALDVRLCQPQVVTAPWLDLQQTLAWQDTLQTAAWLDQQTVAWLDQQTRPWVDQIDTLQETSPWRDQWGTPNKRFDDVKDPSGYDTLMETIQEGGGVTWQEGGGMTWQEEVGGFDPGEPITRPPFARPPVDPGGRTPFAMSTPHHASGAARFERESGGDLEAEIEQAREYLRSLEARRRRGR